MSFATNLSTRSYIAVPTGAFALEAETGWEEVRKGLNGIIFSHLLSFASVLVAGGIGWLVYAQIKGLKEAQELGDVSTIIYAGLGVLFLMGVFSYGMMVRGMWHCLMKAPEREGAKWLMFAALLCFLAGPALNIVAPFVGSDKGRPAAKDERISTILYRSAAKYPKTLTLDNLDSTTYLSLGGTVASWLSGMFFLLFLRAVACCFGASVRVRLTELLIAFTLFLLASTLYQAYEFLESRGHPELLLGAMAGWVLAVVWYFLLLVSTSGMIACGLPRRRFRLD
jgi:hypothetical protein